MEGLSWFGSVWIGLVLSFLGAPSTPGRTASNPGNPNHQLPFPPRCHGTWRAFGRSAFSWEPRSGAMTTWERGDMFRCLPFFDVLHLSFLKVTEGATQAEKIAREGPLPHGPVFPVFLVEKGVFRTKPTSFQLLQSRCSNQVWATLLLTSSGLSSWDPLSGSLDALSLGLLPPRGPLLQTKRYYCPNMESRSLEKKRSQPFPTLGLSAFLFRGLPCFHGTFLSCSVAPFFPFLLVLPLFSLGH